MASDSQLYQDTYTSFTGTDLVASVLGIPIGNLLSVSYSVQREKAGIYTCGSPDPRSISRGKRGIAGSLIFQVFNRDALYEIIHDRAEEFMFTTRYSNRVIADGVYGPTGQPNNYINDWKQQTLAYGQFVPFYADQIPPFDITLTFVNEINNVARMDIKGVEILNEGMGVSIEDMAIEQAMTFICRSVGKINPGGVDAEYTDSRVLDSFAYYPA